MNLPDRPDKLFRLDRFDEIVGKTETYRVHQILRLGERRRGDHPDRRIHLLDLSSKGEAVHLRHGNVCHQNGDMLRGEDTNGLTTTFRRQHRSAEFGKNCRYGPE
ncbi:MAG: hypothetical protein Fur0034_21070 [Desulfuromonadia bacterium]